MLANRGIVANISKFFTMYLTIFVSSKESIANGFASEQFYQISERFVQTRYFFRIVNPLAMKFLGPVPPANQKRTEPRTDATKTTPFS